jgi:glucose/arabinose dehydrogenase
VTTTFLTILVLTTVIFDLLELNPNHTAMALEQPIINDPNLESKLFVKGLSWPTSLAFIDNNNILVLEKEGTVRLVTNGILQKQPALKIDVNSKGERGLLGIAIMNNDMVFLYYTESSSSDYNEELRNRVFKYQWDEEEKTLVNPTLILDLPALPGSNHDGGKLSIGPDKYLYAVIGDLNHKGKLQNFVNGPQPDDTGVILRVNPEDGSPAPDNPFTNIDNNDLKLLNKYYAYGIRNSFGIDFDPVTGKLWDTENGPLYGDEINLVNPGFNSGHNLIHGFWERINYTHHGSYVDDVAEYNLVDFKGNGKYSHPELAWNKTIGITAIKFLNSDKYGKGYQNDLFVANLVPNDDILPNGEIYHFDLNNDRTALVLPKPLDDKIANNYEELSIVTFGKDFRGISDMTVGPDGYLYILTLDIESDGEGKIYKIAWSQ